MFVENSIESQLRQVALKVLPTPVEVDATLSRNNLQLNNRTNQIFVRSTY